QVLQQLQHLITTEQPDLGCLIEIDKGSFNSAYVNQLEHLIDEQYRYYDIENKYGETGHMRHLPVSEGKCIAFFSNQQVGFQKLYFTHGAKRLVYRIKPEKNVTIFFAHFSLRRSTRLQQFQTL